MADALDSKSSVRKGVWVRLPPSVLVCRQWFRFDPLREPERAVLGQCYRICYQPPAGMRPT